MNPVFFAMKHPITTLMFVVGLVCGGAMALDRMRVDIFPPLNEPRIYVFLQYGGMSPEQITQAEAQADEWMRKTKKALK